MSALPWEATTERSDIATLFRFVQPDMPAQDIVIVGPLAATPHAKIGHLHFVNEASHGLTSGRGSGGVSGRLTIQHVMWLVGPFEVGGFQKRVEQGSIVFLGNDDRQGLFRIQLLECDAVRRR